MNPDTIRALQLSLKEGESLQWIHSQGGKVFKVDLSGIVDDEKRVNRYLKMKKT